MADIAINPVTRRVQFTGNTGTGPFAFTFNILADEDIAVYKNTTLLTLTTHYSVTTNANGTGSITLVSGQALVSSDVLTIIGGRDLSRTTDFVTAGDLLASSLNEQLDSLVIMTQQLDEKVGRTIKTNPGDVYTDLELPTKDNRKGTVLGFNATSGDPEVGPTIADVSSLASITADIATLADIEDGTDATDAIQTVAGISSNVTTVAGISSNVTTVAGNTSNINAVAADATDIGTVAGSISNVNTVAGIDSNITTVAGNTTNINTVAGNNSNITTVAGVSANVTTVAGISSDVTTVAGISSDVTTVAADGTDIGTVATNIADVNTVASNIATISAKVSKSGDTMTGDLTIQGNLTVSGTTITVDSATAQTIDLGDGDRMRFGDSNDAYIEWNGTYFDARSTGRFDLLSSGNDLRLSTGTNVGLIVNHTGGTPAVQLYNSGVQRLATTSTGIDVTGTVTADGLTVDGIAKIQGPATGLVINETDTTDLNTYFNANSGDFNLMTTNDAFTSFTTRLNVDHSTGDISFYEDTGTTAKFFWDASAESLGIGTSSPSAKLNVVGSAADNGISIKSGGNGGVDPFKVTWSGGTEGDMFIVDDSGRVGIGTSSPNGTLTVRNDSTNTEQLILGNSLNTGGRDWRLGRDNAASGDFIIKYSDATNSNVTTEAMRIDASGNVGIGTSSIASGGANTTNFNVHTPSATSAYFKLSNSSTGNSTSDGFDLIAASNGTAYVWNRENANMLFATNSTERMRIDTSGNLLVGKTSSSATTQGIQLNADGRLWATATENDHIFNRRTSDGNVISLRKDGTEVGTLQVIGGDLVVNTRTANHSGLRFGEGYIFPTDNTGATSDGAIDLGLSVGRFKDLYLSGNARVGGQVLAGSTGAATPDFSFAADNTLGMFRAPNTLGFSVSGSERMRVDSSGNLIVGKTSTDGNTAGGVLFSGGDAEFVKASQPALYLNRKTSDGSIVEFRKDGSTVGSIGTAFGYMHLGEGVVGLGFRGADNTIYPYSVTGAVARDGAIKLGSSSYRFHSMYLSDGVYLGGTGSANKLDDYEEGVSNPTLSGSTSGTKAGYGTYAKVGSLVLYQFTFNAIGSGLSGNLSFEVPFTNQASNNTGQIYFPIQVYRADWPATAKAFYGYLNYNSTTVSLHWSVDDGVSLAAQGSDVDASDCYVRGTLMYRTDS